jgi:hypothetical protein
VCEKVNDIPVKTKFHQIPSIDGIPWNSMEFSMEKYHEKNPSWNSMENSMN